MIRFNEFLTEANADDGKVKHIHHPEDRPIIDGKKGFEHAMGVLHQASEHIKKGKNDSTMTMKYDGSPAIVFGHDPKTGKFFVASKSAFNKTPKINYTPEDIERNHGHAPGLVEKLKDALKELPKIAPKKGVFQGDLMFSQKDVVHNPNGSSSFTPNTITYSAHGLESQKVKKAKLGVVIHTQYNGPNLHNMKASPEITHKFKAHPDVWNKPATHDTGITNYGPKDEMEFHKHMEAAQKIQTAAGKTMYKDAEQHMGGAGHLSTYINQTVRNVAKPTVQGLQQHILDKSQIVQSRLKTAAASHKKQQEANAEVAHIQKHRESYENLLKMHQHIQKAKDVLVRTLNQHPGTLSHHIEGKETHPEGYVVTHKNEPTKLVNRAEFSRANLMKVRKPNANV
jgi:hypothetical protein